MTDKHRHPMTRVRSEHLRRKAIIYVRQSSPGQVERHRESTALQYGLVDRAKGLGWPAAHIEVIDEDLGRAARSSGSRSGYLRLAAEAARCRVGIIISYDVSRLSRNLADWGGLLEICSQTNTLLADVESVYDLARTNDRFLLGIKGTMSEAEIHVMRQRMHAGREAKAARGELSARLPRGYVHDARGQIVLDADQGVQDSIRGVFKLFARWGSVAATLRQLAREGQKLPQRQQGGERPGQLQWRRPNRPTLHNMLTNPTYAGAYAWGRKCGKGSSELPLEERWRHLIRDHHAGYISWSEFVDNQQRIRLNRWPVRSRGGGLLSGLLRCGKCGWKMRVSYSSGTRSAVQYDCPGKQLDYGGEDKCQSFGAGPLDQHVSELLLSALSPAALELSVRAVAEEELDRARQHQQWQNRRQRAEQKAQHAQRQYESVDPSNRLVAQNLEDRWEAALAAQSRLEYEYQDFCERLPRELSGSERTQLQTAAAGIGWLWREEVLTNSEKAEIARLMMTEVRPRLIGDSERVIVDIQWQGGHRTQTEMRRPVGRYQQLSYYEELQTRALELKKQGLTLVEVASALNQEGWRPARKDRFTAQAVQKLMGRKTSGNAGIKRRKRPDPADRKAHEWLLSELSEQLEIPEPTLFGWIKGGKLSARKEAALPDGKRRRWLVRMDESDMKALREWHQSGNWKKPYYRRKKFPALSHTTGYNAINTLEVD